MQSPELRLELHLDALRWTFLDADGRPLARCESVSGELAHAFPHPRHRATLSLHAPPGEAYVGFGEKAGGLDKRGMSLTFWNTDVVPHHPDTDPLYVSVPFFMGLRSGVAWGFFLDEPWRSKVDVARSDEHAVTWESTGPELDAYLFTGPSPADVLSRFTALTGRPALPPLWALGAHQSRWGYEGEDDVRAVIQGYRSRGLPLDVVHLDIDHQDGYRPLSWDSARFPEPQRLCAEAKEEGVRLVTIVDPGVPARPGTRLYDEAVDQDLLVRTDRGEVLVGEVWPRRAVFPDFTQPKVSRWWAAQHRAFLDARVPGFWNDMNEPSCFSLPDADALRSSVLPDLDASRAEPKTLPDYARHGARRHLEVHNVYGQAMAQAAVEAQRQHAPGRRPFVLTRAAYAGIQRLAAVWTGDNSSHWSHLELSIPMLCGMGVSGLAFVGADIPGFIGTPSPELAVRWAQLGTFYPLMRNHSAKGVSMREPWRFGEAALAHIKAALERRYRLLPTLYTLMHEASSTGLPVMRPLFLHDSGSEDCLAAQDAFLFGRDLLVAPVVRPRQSKRLAFLPRGSWLPWDEGARGEAVEGPLHLVAEAPLERVPMWLRAGGGVALTSPASHTRTANWTELSWHLHVAPSFSAQLYEDEGDGDGPSRLTSLEGSVQRGALVLERRAEGELPLERKTETLWLHGVKQPREVSGALEYAFLAGALKLTVAASWERVEVSS